MLPAMRLREHEELTQPFFTTGYTPNGLEQALAHPPTPPHTLPHRHYAP